MDQSEINRYRAALSLDPDGSDLAEAISRQSSQHEEIYRNYGYAKSRAAEAGTLLDECLQQGVRAERAKSGNSKTTVTELKATVMGGDEYGDKARRKAQADSEVDQWKGLRESSRHRKDMIGHMKDLLIAGHLNGNPSPTRRSAEERERYKTKRAAMVEDRKSRKQNNPTSTQQDG